MQTLGETRYGKCAADICRLRSFSRSLCQWNLDRSAMGISLVSVCVNGICIASPIPSYVCAHGMQMLPHSQTAQAFSKGRGGVMTPGQS
jgi:hypothetical protein